NRCVHPRGACFAGEPAARDQSTDAIGSTPLPFPNCVHYVTEPVGEHVKFLVCAGARPVACFAWSSSAHYLGCRDRFLGWSAAARRKNIRLLAYNSRFLLLPWVEIRCLASHLLARMTGMLSAEWERVYGHPIYFVETFIDPERYRGTCYRAANWKVL